MGRFILRIDGAEVECQTLEDLAAAKALFNGSTGNKANKPLPPAPPKSQPRLQAVPGGSALVSNHPSTDKKHRAVAEHTYLKYAWKIVRLLLAEKSEVGRMAHTLATEIGVNRTTSQIIFLRLEQEQPSFMYIHKGRKSGSFLRLTNREAAMAFADAKEKLYKEQLEKELKQLPG
jgi:hypothetical protein